MSRDWFKVWALPAINSADLDELSDHEERVWWRLLMWASLEEDRWRIRPSPKLAGKCGSTPAKFNSAVQHFTRLDMVREEEGGRLFLVNGPKWNEDTEKKRKPSDDPERVRERVSRHRNATGNADVTPDVTPEKRPSLFEEEEKREEGSPTGDPQEREEDFGAAKPPRKSLRLIPLTPEQRLVLLGDFPFPGVAEQIDLALSHKSHRNYPDNQIGYVRNWLRRWAGDLREVPTREPVDATEKFRNDRVMRAHLAAKGGAS